MAHTVNMVIIYMVTFGVIFSVLAIHELGHILVGLAQGFAFQLFVIGPLGIKAEKNGIKFYLNKELAYYGGVAASTPVDDDPSNAKKFCSHDSRRSAGIIDCCYFSTDPCCYLSFIIYDKLRIGTFGLYLIGSIFCHYHTFKNRHVFLQTARGIKGLRHRVKTQNTEIALLNIMGVFYRDNSYRNVNEADILALMDADTPFYSYFGYFNKICFVLEIEKKLDRDAWEKYQSLKPSVSKNITKSFDKEIEIQKNKFGVVDDHFSLTEGIK